MSERTDEMIKALVEFIGDERYQQAALIDGAWGSGKTFFVKQRLVPQIKETKEMKVIYVSLYGVSSEQEISDGIYKEILSDWVESKLGKKTGRLAVETTGMLAKLIPTIASAAGIDTSNLSGLKEYVNKIQLDKMLLIIDDIERCNVEINVILGVINRFVEHEKAKVILVANQEEIGKANHSELLPQKYIVAANSNITVAGDEKKPKEGYSVSEIEDRANAIFAEQSQYRTIKEKLIGLTIFYRANMHEVYEEVIGGYVRDEKTKRFLLSNKDIVVGEFEKRGHSNIRTLIFSVIAFEKFCTIIDGISTLAGECENEKGKILRYTVVLSIYLKSGKTIDEWGKNVMPADFVYFGQLSAKNSEHIYGFKFVHDYILHYYLNTDEIVEVVTAIVNEHKQREREAERMQSLKYNQLYQWWKQEDDEIECKLSEMKRELSEYEYEPRYFKDIVVTLMQLEYVGFKINYDDYIQPMKATMEKEDIKYDTRCLEMFSDDKDFREKYYGIVKPLLEIKEKHEIADRNSENAFLFDIDEWNEEFQDKCASHRDKYITDNKFLGYIDPGVFLVLLEKATTRQIVDVSDGVRKVYNFGNLNEFFEADVPVIKEMLDGIDVEKMSRGKITRRKAIERLKEILEESMESISKPVKK